MKAPATRICIPLLWLLCLAGPVTSATSRAAPPAPAGATVYRLAPGQSEVHILVFRAGALGRFGHNHVITARELEGSVILAETPAASAFELTVPVDQLAVDDAAARRAAGSAFGGDVSEDDRAGTRRNMLGTRLLDAGRYPEVHVRSTGISGSFEDMRVTAEVEIRGARHTVELPVSALVYGDRLVATGHAELTHADLGLEPFSAGLGTLKVAEDLMFRYRLVALAEDGDEEPSADQGAFAVIEHDGAALAHGRAE